MSVNPQDAPLVAIHNNLETFFKFLQRADDPDILAKRRHRGERGIFWLGDPKLLFVTASSPAVDWICRQWGYPGTSVLAPAQPTHQLCLDILREPPLLDCILDHAGPGRTVRLVPYASTLELFQLADALRQRGLTVLLPESPSPQNLWLRDYADSKSGFRSIASRCLQGQSILPPGFICQDISRAAGAVEWFLERGLACVVKADSGESGIGHLIFEPHESARAPVLPVLQGNPFLRNDLVLVEQLIPSAGLSPSLEFFVPPSAAGHPSATYLSQQTFSNFGRFAGVMISRSLEQAHWYPQLLAHGLKLAAALQEMGYVGHFDLDTVIDDHGHLFLLEINARRTGGTYVHEFARFTFGGDYIQHVALLSQNALPSGGLLTLEALQERISGLLFRAYGPESGVVVTVTSTLPAGEFGCILVAPDEAGLHKLNQALIERLHPHLVNDGKEAGRFETILQELQRCQVVDRLIPSDLLLLPDAVQDALQQAYRQGRVSAGDLSAALDLEPSQARSLAEMLLQKGYLQPLPPGQGEGYAARFSGRLNRPAGSPLDKL